MSKAFASGKHAFGYCDRCGFRYKLSRLKKEKQNETTQNLLVCQDCFDPDHPQNRLGRIDYSDAIGLREPRPDLSANSSRSMGGFNPVNGFQISVEIGRVAVV